MVQCGQPEIPRLGACPAGPGILQRVLQGQTAYSYSARAPEDALRTALTLRPGRTRDELINTSMLHWGLAVKEGTKEGEALLRTVENLPPRDRMTAVERLITYLPPEMLGRMDLRIFAGEGTYEADHLARLVTSSLTRQNQFEEAAEKLAALPEKALRGTDNGSLRADLFVLWWSRSPEAATTWLSGLPPEMKHGAFSKASAELLNNRQTSSRDLADLAARLDSPESVKYALDAWSQTDAAAAAAWKARQGAGMP